MKIKGFLLLILLLLLEDLANCSDWTDFRNDIIWTATNGKYVSYLNKKYKCNINFCLWIRRYGDCQVAKYQLKIVRNIKKNYWAFVEFEGWLLKFSL